MECIPNNLSQRPVHTFYVAELCEISKANFPKNLDIDTENDEMEKADDEMLNDNRWLIFIIFAKITDNLTPFPRLYLFMNGSRH